MMYLSRDDKDVLIDWLQSAEELDVYKEGYEEGFKRGVNLACELINDFED